MKGGRRQNIDVRHTSMYRAGKSLRKLNRLAVLLLLSVTLLNCSFKDSEVEHDVVIVRIPPRIDPASTAGESHCVFYKWWNDPDFRKEEALRTCAGASLPNDGVPLLVRMELDGSLRINSEPAGMFADRSTLTGRLRELFEEREKHSVFADGTTMIEKSVALVVPRAAKQRDAVGLALSLKEAGADPIILAIDGYILPPTLVAPPIAK